MTRIGLIGAGSIGSNVAAVAVKHGDPVIVSNSRGPETLGGLVARLGRLARAGTTAEAARDSDVIVIATPLSALDRLPVQELRGKIVVDANNYSPERDGHIAELDDGSVTQTGLLQRMLPESGVVKAFNQIHAPQINSDSKKKGTPDRRALAVFADDAAARARVAELIDSWGFDPVVGGTLAESWRIERDTPGWDVYDTRPQLEAHLAKARHLLGTN